MSSREPSTLSAVRASRDHSYSWKGQSFCWELGERHRRAPTCIRALDEQTQGSSRRRRKSGRSSDPAAAWTLGSSRYGIDIFTLTRSRSRGRLSRLYPDLFSDLVARDAGGLPSAQSRRQVLRCCLRDTRCLLAVRNVEVGVVRIRAAVGVAVHKRVGRRVVGVAPR